MAAIVDFPFRVYPAFPRHPHVSIDAARGLERMAPIESREGTMSGFEVLATNRTSFTDSDLDRSLLFFRDGLGFEVASRAPRDSALIQAITGVEDASLDIAFVRGPGHNLSLTVAML
jgi:hypothetical protein